MFSSFYNYANVSVLHPFSLHFINLEFFLQICLILQFYFIFIDWIYLNFFFVIFQHVVSFIFLSYQRFTWGYININFVYLSGSLLVSPELCSTPMIVHLLQGPRTWSRELPRLNPLQPSSLNPSSPSTTRLPRNRRVNDSTEYLE